MHFFSMRIMGKILYNIIRDGLQSEQEFVCSDFVFFVFMNSKKAMTLKHDESQDIEEQFILRLPQVSNVYISEWISSVQKCSSA